ncbi:cytochrome P450 [Natrialbaceae archaeon A-CW3]
MATDDTTDLPGRSDDRLSSDERATIRDLVYGFMSAEFASSRGGKPATFPLTPFYDTDRETIIVTSPVAYAGKVRSLERDPRVSLLLHDGEGEYLVTGDARVRDDDPAANAEYVRELTENEPMTPKRAANEEKFDFLESRLGHALVGWIGQRIAVEIEPKSIIRVSDPSPPPELPDWSDAGMSTAEATEYDRAVLTVVGDDGYPVTQPVTAVRHRDDGGIIDPLPAEAIRDGQPACLLAHWHDDASIYLGQRLIRGRFRLDGDDAVPRFVPGSSSTLRNDGLVDTLRFVVDGKRKTRAYLRETARADDSTHDGLPPGPHGRPLVGNTVQFVRDPFRFYEALPSYGDVVRYRVGWNTWTAVLHPDAVERVLVSESHRFRRYNFEELGFDFVSEGLFFTDGEQWRRQRKLIQPAFSPAALSPFGETIVSRTDATVDRWADGETIIANREYSQLVLEILSTTLFDLDLDDRRDIVTEAGHALADRVDTQSLSAFLPSQIPTPKNRRFDRQMARFDELVQTLIEERRADTTDRDDLLSTLLERTKTDGNDPGTVSSEGSAAKPGTATDSAFTDEELRDQLVTFLFAGHETTALALTYASLAVARHDEVRRKLEVELADVCGDRNPTVEDIPDLEYAEKVIKETMRYYPPVYVLFREAREDVVLDGYLIPEGTKVAIPQLILHSDERWWDEPQTFRPERWTDEFLDERPEYAYFPFGGGPRHCVGMRFATMTLILALATVVRRVRFERATNSDPDLRLSATLSPASGVELAVRKRGR